MLMKKYLKIGGKIVKTTKTVLKAPRWQHWYREVIAYYDLKENSFEIQCTSDTNSKEFPFKSKFKIALQIQIVSEQFISVSLIQSL